MKIMAYFLNMTSFDRVLETYARLSSVPMSFRIGGKLTVDDSPAFSYTRKAMKHMVNRVVHLLILQLSLHNQSDVFANALRLALVDSGKLVEK